MIRNKTCTIRKEKHSHGHRFQSCATPPVVAANSHYYKTPTEVLYIDRVLPYHDLIYLVDGGWMITENGVDYPLEKGDVLLLAAGRHHYTRLPSLPETRTICIHITCEPGDDENEAGTLTLPSLLHMKGAPEVKRYFEEIVTTLWAEKPHKQERMSALFTLLALELYERQTKIETDCPAIADEVMRIINAAPHKRYKLAEIADMLYVSTKTLGKRHAQERGHVLFRLPEPAQAGNGRVATGNGAGCAPKGNRAGLWFLR